MTTTQAPQVRMQDRPDLGAWWRRWGGTVVAAAVVAAFLLVTRAQGYSQGNPDGSYTTVGIVALLPGVRLLLVVAGTVSVLSVLLSRVWPLRATALALAPFGVVPWTQWFVWGWLLALLAIMVLVAARRPVQALAPYAAALGVAGWFCGSSAAAQTPIGAVTAGGSGAEYEVLTLVLYAFWFTATLAVAIAVGAAGRSRQQQRAAVVQERRARDVEQLVQERARMARDLHDVVAHHVSLIAVRAESAPYQHPDLDPAARQVLVEIADDARAALGELRQALSVLRRTDADPGELAPQPDASAVDGLLATAVSAGQRVDVVGSWQGVPAGPGYVLYRAVQEGLTNARRHAPAATVRVERTQDDGRVGFTMTNDAPGATAVVVGRGLLGMRERVEALGGRVEATATGERFVLTVDLPEQAAP
ncbi:sensor histidine kinase [Cellulomonas sp. SLBN-39]|uniref:sensor histidine kinase n=1 Tax=Cellulomonas sp. SLBN-39 TaxID=2768446 RepID=UPI0011522AB1|nr:histidine kinase [Cellulomonas sp. SLBN-39]TQL02587.1 signal transduction histidine kinase [Cellulomonas sp. SLBN-39]